MSPFTRLGLPLILLMTTSLSGGLTGCALSSGQARVAPGYLDQRAVLAASQLHHVERLELHAAPTGRLEKIEVYHQDQAAVPEVVRKLVDAQFPGYRLLHYEFEVIGQGDPIHELEVETADKRNCEVSATAAGALRYVECPLSPVPEAITGALTKLFPGKTPDHVVALKGPTIDEIEAELTLDDGIHQVKLRPSGELIVHWRRLPAIVQIPVPIK